MKRKNKKAEIFGMSFSMIFSIILIVFFIYIGFIGIRYFLCTQKASQTGFFVNDLKNKIAEARACDKECDFPFKASVPSAVDYICFINVTQEVRNANDIEKNFYNEILKGKYILKDNLYIHTEKANECISPKNTLIPYIDLSEKNPVCFKASSGKIEIKIKREYGKTGVKVYY